MTLEALLEIPWSPLRDYPKTCHPDRATVEARLAWRNEHGVPMRTTVYANRTRKRFWLEILVGEPGTLWLYQTTVSRKRADKWISCISA